MEEGIQPQPLHVADSYFALASPRPAPSWSPSVLRDLRKSCALLAQREIPLRLRLARVLRTLRVLLYYRGHAELCKLDTYANYVAPRVAPDLFHHMSRRHYLARNLGLRQRLDFVLTHYRFEDATFNSAYKRKVYREDGLQLWSRNVRGTDVEMRLCLADRYAAEGDLSVLLLVDQERLHCISFSWANAEFARPKQTIVPFITATQGRGRQDVQAQEKFDAAFPQNAPNFVCFAAMQGIAQAIGAAEMLAVSRELQVCFRKENEKHFGNAYDIFWNAVGGVELAACGFVLPVPRPMKQLDELPAKHRRRTAARRKVWDDISDSTSAAMSAHFRTHQDGLRPADRGQTKGDA
jgi:uncharacterized protein